MLQLKTNNYWFHRINKTRMKTINVICIVLLCGAGKAFAQVSWQYNIVHLSSNKYKLSITAIIEKGWHLYAQKQPTTAIAEPTAISFATNPLIDFTTYTQEE